VSITRNTYIPCRQIEKLLNVTLDGTYSYLCLLKGGVRVRIDITYIPMMYHKENTAAFPKTTVNSAGIRKDIIQKKHSGRLQNPATSDISRGF
jgi:hypothetical protein